MDIGFQWVVSDKALVQARLLKCAQQNSMQPSRLLSLTELSSFSQVCVWSLSANCKQKLIKPYTVCIPAWNYLFKSDRKKKADLAQFPHRSICTTHRSQLPCLGQTETRTVPQTVECSPFSHRDKPSRPPPPSFQVKVSCEPLNLWQRSPLISGLQNPLYSFTDNNFHQPCCLLGRLELLWPSHRSHRLSLCYKIILQNLLILLNIWTIGSKTPAQSFQKFWYRAQATIPVKVTNIPEEKNSFSPQILPPFPW